MLVDGPYWTKALAEGTGSSLWKSLQHDGNESGTTVEATTHPWDVVGEDLLRMERAGYGGQKTCADLFKWAVHAMLVWSSYNTSFSAVSNTIGYSSGRI